MVFQNQLCYWIIFRIWILFVFIIVGNKLNLIDKVLFKGLLIKSELQCLISLIDKKKEG